MELKCGVGRFKAELNLFFGGVGEGNGAVKIRAHMVTRPRPVLEPNRTDPPGPR